MKIIKNRNISWWVGAVSCVALFLFIGVFAYMKMSFLFYGVQIEAKIERNDDSSLVYINGNAKYAIYITINGREIYIDKKGNFREPMILVPGFSVITIDAKDKFGKKDEKKFQVVYEGSELQVAFDNDKQF